MEALCPKCRHSIFDHDTSHDGCCDAKGCTCHNNFEDATSSFLVEFDHLLHDILLESCHLGQLVDRLPDSPLHTRIGKAAAKLSQNIAKAAQLPLAADGGDKAPNDVYSHPECTWNYCCYPNGGLCREKATCLHPAAAKA